MPTITKSLEDDLDQLLDLEDQLPEIGSQIRDIRRVYDHGREKVSGSLVFCHRLRR